MNSTVKAKARPPILLCESDADRIADLAVGVESRLPQVAAMLLKEIDRARVVKDGALPADVVGMGSRVRFRDESAGTERTVRLVYPSEADIEAGKVSILTPIGAGLIGLREGQSIRWEDREGHPKILQVIAVGEEVDSAV